MQYNEKELIDALNVIQGVCTEYRGRDCEFCPLRNADDGCGLFQTREDVDILSPLEWEVKKPEDKSRVLMY